MNTGVENGAPTRTISEMFSATLWHVGHSLRSIVGWNVLHDFAAFLAGLRRRIPLG
jgi:hypothetical protein